MSGIRISVLPPSREGKLLPKYDAESDILSASSPVTRDWPYGVDIDGNIVFDLDAARVLANFDLHVGRRLWERTAAHSWPDNAPRGTLVFSPDAIERKSFTSPLRVKYSESQGVVRIEFDTLAPDRMLGLSDDCIALLARDQLVGFVVRRF